MKKMKFVSLRYKFTLFFLCTVLIPIFLISLISYNIFFDTIQEKISRTNHMSIRQVGKHLEFTFDDIRQLSLDLYQDAALRTILLNQNNDTSNSKLLIANYESNLRNIIASNNYIHSIYIESNDGNVINPITIKDDLTDPLKNEVNSLNGFYLWKSTSIQIYGEERPSLSLIRTLRDVKDITHNLGILKINISEKTISNIYKDNLIDSGSDLFIINNRGTIISSSNPDQLNLSFDPGLFTLLSRMINKTGYETTIVNDQKYLLTYYHLDNTEWILVNLVPLEALMKGSDKVFIDIFMTIIISFILFAIVTLSFLHRLLKPLNAVTSVMKEIENENFLVQLEPKGNDEITLLGHSFNQMSSKLNELMNQVYIEKIKQKDAELQALQAQINPHFLYNTLDIIYWMSCIENAKDTAILVKALAKLFRLSLNQGNEVTTVENEVEHLRNYILIQQQRYQELITFDITIEDDVLDCQVIKLILQPLVENSIYHGIEPKGEPGTISIHIYTKEGVLYYVVKDDGVGTDSDKINHLFNLPYNTNEAYGFALKNVSDRIKLRYGSYYDITFESIPGSGTSVLVKQPYIKGGNELAEINDRR